MKNTLWIARMAIGVCGLSAASVVHAQAVEVVLASSPITLQANLAGQRVVVNALNTTGSGLQLLSVNLTFQVADGIDSSSVPSITAVDFSTGTPWASLFSVGLVSYTISQPSAQVYNVNFGVSLSAPDDTAVTLPTGISRLAEVTFDTTFIASGTWDFSVSNVNTDYATDTEFTTSALNTIHPKATLGTVSLSSVPETEGMATLAGIGLLGWLGWRRWNSTSLGKVS